MPMFVLTTLLLLFRGSNGFVVPSSSSSSRCSFHTAATPDRREFQSLEELDQARRQFDSLIRKDWFHQTQQQKSANSYTTPYMTFRKARLEEMKILEKLLHESDDDDENDPIEELTQFWLHERDAHAAYLLTKMEDDCSPGLAKEEKILRNMVKLHGDSWAEPSARLATLLHFTKRYEKSVEFANRALQIKPWHFEAINLQLLNYEKMEKEAPSALLEWVLPEEVKDRRKWVQKAIRAAQEQLQRVEEQVLVKEKASSVPLVRKEASLTPENTWQ